MYEFHGWATVRYHTHDIDAARQAEAWGEVCSYVEALEVTGLLETAQHNGVEIVCFHGHTNHRAEWPLELLRFIGRVAPGSYGLLYVRDDEDPRGEPADSAFCVWRLHRGRVDEHRDDLLSPCIPTIEDPYDPSRPDG